MGAAKDTATPKAQMAFLNMTASFLYEIPGGIDPDGTPAHLPCQACSPFGRAYSHHIPLARLKCLSEKRRLELAGRLGGEPGGARKLESSRHGYFRPLFRSGA